MKQNVSANCVLLWLRIFAACANFLVYGDERFGYLTAESLRAQSQEFLIKRYSELGVSVVKYHLLYWLRLCRTGSKQADGKRQTLTIAKFLLPEPVPASV